MKLYGIAWDGWKVLNIGNKEDLMKQVDDNWLIYDTYAIKDMVSGETIVFTKDEVVNQGMAG